MECPTCHAEVGDDARFCSSCGAELTRRYDERRVVTVLFADIVGFTGLSETRDPEQVKNLVDRCFARLADDITAFGGRVDKVIGDAIVALFGAPIAHEDDAERAVRAALRMQDTVERLDGDAWMGIQVRIGVNTGEVLVGAISAGDDYTAMGDVVNTASRLQSAAEPGAVLVGPVTHAATAEVIHYRSVGRLHARGREEPVPAWRAIEPVGQPGERRSEPKAPLIGRKPEIDALRRAVTAAFRRNRAQLVTLVGESGVGKSRLAREVAELARIDHDAVVLHGRCLPYGEANAWWPVAEALRERLGLAPDLAPDVATVAVESAVRELLPAEIDDVNVARTAEGLRHLLGHESGLDRLSPERAAEEARRAARALVLALALHSPVVVWISDLDWGDAAVVDLLDEMLERLGRLPLVVLVSTRATLFDRWAPSPGRFDAFTLAVEPLAADDATELARELLPDAADDVRAELVERAGGNPLFLEEMARMVSGTAETSIEQLPANVRSVISARLDALEPDALHVIEDAAVLGLRGTVVALERMAEYERSQLDLTDPLRALERSDLLEVFGTFWSFRSNLVREVVYGRLTKTDRAFRHAGIAAWIEANLGVGKPGGGAETIGYHYRQAARLARELGGVDGLRPDLDDVAIRFTLDAARAIGRSAGLERASDLFTEVLELMTSDDPRRPVVLLERADAALKALETDRARDDLAQVASMVASSGDPRLRVRLELLESELAQWSGDQELALHHARTAMDLAGSIDDAQLAGDALRRLGLVRLFRGEHDEAEASINAASDRYAEAGDASGLAWARQNLAWIAFNAGNMKEAERRLWQAVEAFEALGDLSGTAWSRGLLAYVRIYAGRFAEAEQFALQTLEEARESGDKWGEAMMNVALANTALWTGRVDEATQRAVQARELFPDPSDPVGASQARAIEGRALMLSGRIAEGFRVLDDAVERYPAEPAHSFMEGARLSAAAGVGDPAHGRAALTEVRTFDPNVLGEADRVVATALIHLQAGDPSEAKRLVDVLPAAASGEGSGWGWAVLALVAAATEEDADHNGVDHYDVDHYAALVEASGRATYSDRVLARCATACAATRRGDADGARVALQRAYDAIPVGGDRLHPTIVAIAEAVCLAALGGEDAPAVAGRTHTAARAIGLDEAGWHTVFALGCGVDPDATVSGAAGRE